MSFGSFALEQHYEAWGNEETIRDLGLGRVCGMTASDEEHDYVHLLAEKVRQFIPGKQESLFFSKPSEFEILGRLCLLDLVVFHYRNMSVRGCLPTVAKDYTDILNKLRDLICLMKKCRTGAMSSIK